jgi:hypothetical protein
MRIFPPPSATRKCQLESTGRAAGVHWGTSLQRQLFFAVSDNYPGRRKHWRNLSIFLLQQAQHQAVSGGVVGKGKCDLRPKDNCRW